MKAIKDYKDVQVGDRAYLSPDAGFDPDYIGIVVWKGTTKEFRAHDDADEYAYLFDNLEEEWGMSEEEIDENYNLVIVDGNEDGDNFGDGLTLFNYNCDPSGVVCYETTRVTMRFMIPVEITWNKEEVEDEHWEEFLEDIDAIDHNPGLTLRENITDDDILEIYHDAIDNGNIEPIKIIKG